MKSKASFVSVVKSGVYRTSRSLPFCLCQLKEFVFPLQLFLFGTRCFGPLALDLGCSFVSFGLANHWLGFYCHVALEFLLFFWCYIGLFVSSFVNLLFARTKLIGVRRNAFLVSKCSCCVFRLACVCVCVCISKSISNKIPRNICDDAKLTIKTPR